jgi:hypothetical protein
VRKEFIVSFIAEGNTIAEPQEQFVAKLLEVANGVQLVQPEVDSDERYALNATVAPGSGRVQ